jgi:hypothetical protein
MPNSAGIGRISCAIHAIGLRFCKKHVEIICLILVSPITLAPKHAHTLMSSLCRSTTSDAGSDPPQGSGTARHTQQELKSVVRTRTEGGPSAGCSSRLLQGYMVYSEWMPCVSNPHAVAAPLPLFPHTHTRCRASHLHSSTPVILPTGQDPIAGSLHLQGQPLPTWLLQTEVCLERLGQSARASGHQRLWPRPCGQSGTHGLHADQHAIMQSGAC